MRSTCNRSLWIILLLISTQCVLVTKQKYLKVQQRETEHLKQIQQQQQKIKEVKEQQLEFVQTVKQRPADIASKWSTEQPENSELILKQKLKVSLQNENRSTEQENVLPSIDDNNEKLFNLQQQQKQHQQHEYKKQLNKTECAKSSLQTTKTIRTNSYTYSEISKSANSHTTIENNNKSNNNNNNNKNNNNNNISTLKSYYIQHDSHNSTPAVSKIAGKKDVKLLKESFLAVDDIDADADFTQTHKLESIGNNNRKTLLPTTTNKRDKNVATKKYYNNNKRILHVAYSNRHRMLRDRLTSKIYKNRKNHKDNILTHKKFKGSFKHFAKRETAVQRNDVELNLKKNRENMNNKKVPKKSPTLNEQKNKVTTTTSNNNNQQNQTPFDERNSPYTSTLDIWSVPFDWSPTENKQLLKPKEPIIIIDDIEEFDSGTMNNIPSMSAVHNRSEDYSHLDQQLEPRASPLRPLIADPFENNEEISVVYADQHTEIRLMCEVDLDIASSTWYKNGQVVHAIDRTSRATDYRFIKEPNGALTITNVMLEDDGKWQCEAENTRRYAESARPVKLVVLDRPKAPYLLIDGRRLDAGNIFVPVKESSELNLACVSEGGNPKPTLSWEVLLSPGIDRHTQKVAAEVLELQEIKNEKDASGHKSNGGSKSEARLPAVYRAHHNARILCVMEHPTLKVRQNASLLLDVQYTPSFAISRTPGFGYPLREGIEVSLKCDVDSNPPSTPHWQKDDGETPVPQNGDGFLNFTSIRREHSGWYKCTSRHLNFQYSSIGYYLSVRFDSVEVTSEPDDQDVSVAAASHNPKQGQLEVQLGGTVTLQCPQGSLGCWSHLDPVTARLRGLGQGLSMPTGQFSIKDVVYQDAGTYKCVGQSPTNKKKFEVLQTVGVAVKGAPTVVARDAAPVAYPGSPLHLAVEFCANPPAHAARWLHGDRVFTPGNQYGSSVLAYAVMDLPTPFCKEARLTYVSMHERVERIFYFIVSTPGGVAEAMFKVNFTKRFRKLSNSVEDDGEKLSEPEEIHFPVFGVKSAATATPITATSFGLGIIYTGHLLLYFLLNLFHY